ncbi:hemerythrin domain-containing protein [Planosporangium thailandense]|uniref:Hemerythrin domain-containing protein n=1 Tax=Planosporangium thailandense TaxID=765197 RepID=A0ABX0Y1L4_9ACTN|nr:hemerythrin domain-containing protein [Planosporangium thailandense]NJC71928.1 hemerythrin domain-containing protein [Planosporangium thailandense]
MTATTPEQVDTRDMLVIHTALRREYRLAPALVRTVAPRDTTRACDVSEHLEFLNGMLHHHHSGEDRLLWPKLLERVPAEVAPTVELMEQQHHGIHDAMEQVNAAMARWREHATTADRDQLADSLDRLNARLTEHLAAEEEHILPLAARSLTPAEWGQLGEEGMAGVPKNQRALVFGMLMYEGDPQVIAEMLAHAPRLLRFVLPTLARRAYGRYARRVHGTPTP